MTVETYIFNRKLAALKTGEVKAEKAKVENNKQTFKRLNMSINLDIAENILSNENKEKIHYIPANSNGNGPADVEKQFDQYTITDENGFYSNSLRGYPLKGAKLQVPEGYTGICFQERCKPLDEISDRLLKAFGTFDNFTYWNYDKIPNKGDPFNQALQICDIAQELSKPISIEDIEKEMNTNKSEVKTE